LRDGKPVSGIIDCLYRPVDAWKIVDFKTDQLRDRAAMLDRITARGYDRQISTYAAAAEAFLGERPAAALCFLDVGGAVEVF
ncbi:MAG: PD-(D/E)XK nuclease family protein, partial [Thermoflexales bacterium]|nr:PD-(D/E)XK nuclease family protein [Thermoflexales bacterium]